MSPNRQMAKVIRPGGRTARVRAAVIQGVLAELTAAGYDDLTVEAVAVRSGVHKATIYRRWGGVDGLIADALANSAETPWQIPNTGTLANDLLGITRAVLAGFTDPQSAVTATALINAALRSPRGAQALASFFSDRFNQATQVVIRAVERSELSPDVDPLEIIHAATAPLYYRLFITGEPLDDDVAKRAAAAAEVAAHAGVFDRVWGKG